MSLNSVYDSIVSLAVDANTLYEDLTDLSSVYLVPYDIFIILLDLILIIIAVIHLLFLWMLHVYHAVYHFCADAKDLGASVLAFILLLRSSSTSAKRVISWDYWSGIFQIWTEY